MEFEEDLEYMNQQRDARMERELNFNLRNSIKQSNAEPPLLGEMQGLENIYTSEKSLTEIFDSITRECDEMGNIEELNEGIGNLIQQKIETFRTEQSTVFEEWKRFHEGMHTSENQPPSLAVIIDNKYIYGDIGELTNEISFSEGRPPSNTQDYHMAFPSIRIEPLAHNPDIKIIESPEVPKGQLLDTPRGHHLLNPFDTPKSEKSNSNIFNVSYTQQGGGSSFHGALTLIRDDLDINSQWKAAQDKITQDYSQIISSKINHRPLHTELSKIDRLQLNNDGILADKYTYSGWKYIYIYIYI